MSERYCQRAGTIRLTIKKEPAAHICRITSWVSAKVTPLSSVLLVSVTVQLSKSRPSQNNPSTLARSSSLLKSAIHIPLSLAYPRASRRALLSLRVSYLRVLRRRWSSSSLLRSVNGESLSPTRVRVSLSTTRRSN